ncbi:hypothetical protein H4R18_001509 [Coemansia javaensis]|uniref:RING-type domain-containing protein n=1 Tax=Coemansia javaensis TaxID=2761396 RepID=A0A9W8HGX9_9FUNG|nr:hypothetical protein H4R18_001509 [Coemansia javaensis]
MVRHSKNNTASSVFTYAERQMTGYGTQQRRLGRDAKRGFDTCYLCLSRAREPVMACPQGHVSCRECVLASILEQKQALARDAQQHEARLARDRQARESERAASDAREVGRLALHEVGLSGAGGSKRALDEAAAAAAAGGPEDGKRARARTGGSSSSRQSSFWLPSRAPAAEPALRAPGGEVQCHAAAPHRLQLKRLVQVRFRTSAAGDRLCPSCDRALLNSSTIDLLRPCGHVLCHRCTETFVLPAAACFVCQHRIRPSDVVRIASEGTGFAAAGGPMVATRYDSALQA